MRVLRFLFLSLFLLFGFWVQAEEEYPEEESFTHDYNKGYVLFANDNGVGENITLQFGTALSEYFKWDAIIENFVLSDTLRVGGNVELTENKLIFDVDNTDVGSDVSIIAKQGADNDGEIRYNSTENRWEVSDDGGSFKPLSGEGGLAPYIESVQGQKVSPGASASFRIVGTNFDYNSSVTIPGWEGSIDGIEYISPEEIKVDITAGGTETFYSVVINNSGLDSTGYSADNGVNAIEVKSLPDWIDLRVGGTSLSTGSGAGLDVRHASSLSVSRDGGGMFFTGASPWASWVKFDVLGWNRGAGQAVEWVFTRPDSAMMIGIGSTGTDESNTAQYAQAEVQAYFNNATNLWGLYGNNGSIGVAGNQNVNTSIAGGTGIYKLKFEDDGGVGSTFTLYELPNSDPNSWGDESNIKNSFVVGGSLNPDESSIMPFIIPRSGGAQRFIAVRTY